MTEGRDPREMLADADDLRRAVAETRELGGHAASRSGTRFDLRTGWNGERARLQTSRQHRLFII